MVPLSRRVAACLCYMAALRVPVVAVARSEWAFSVPAGLLIAGLVWWWSRRRCPFLHHHAREGFRWSLQANLVMAALAVISMFLHFLWVRFALGWSELLWRLMAVAVQWAGIPISILTVLMMYRALRGSTGDPLDFARQGQGSV